MSIGSNNPHDQGNNYQGSTGVGASSPRGNSQHAPASHSGTKRKSDEIAQETFKETGTSSNRSLTQNTRSPIRARKQVPPEKLAAFESKLEEWIQGKEGEEAEIQEKRALATRLRKAFIDGARELKIETSLHSLPEVFGLMQELERLELVMCNLHEFQIGSFDSESPQSLLHHLSITAGGEESITLVNMPRLKTLSHGRIPDIERDQLSEFAQVVIQMCDELEQVDLSSSYFVKSVEIERCSKLVKVQLPLETVHLQLSHVDRLSSIEAHQEQCTVRTINLEHCPVIKELPLEQIEEITNLNVTYADRLEKLDLEEQTNLEECVVQHCSSLKSVNLYLCNLLERIDLSVLTKLNNLNLEGCTDLGQVFIVETSIESLDLQEAETLTDLRIEKCPSLRKVFFPRQSKTIGQALEDNLNLEEGSIAQKTMLLHRSLGQELTNELTEQEHVAKLLQLKHMKEWIEKFVDLPEFHITRDVASPMEEDREIDDESTSSESAVGLIRRDTEPLPSAQEDVLDPRSIEVNFAQEVDTDTLRQLQLRVSDPVQLDIRLGETSSEASSTVNSSSTHYPLKEELIDALRPVLKNIVAQTSLQEIVLPLLEQATTSCGDRMALSVFDICRFYHLYERAQQLSQSPSTTPKQLDEAINALYFQLFAFSLVKEHAGTLSIELAQRNPHLREGQEGVITHKEELEVYFVLAREVHKALNLPSYCPPMLFDHEGVTGLEEDRRKQKIEEIVQEIKAATAPEQKHARRQWSRYLSEQLSSAGADTNILVGVLKTKGRFKGFPDKFEILERLYDEHPHLTAEQSGQMLLNRLREAIESYPLREKNLPTHLR